MEINYIRKYSQDDVEFVYLEYASSIYCIDVLNSGEKSDEEVIGTAKLGLAAYFDKKNSLEISPEDKLHEEYIKNYVGTDTLIEPLFEAFTEFCRQNELHFEKLDYIYEKRQEIKRSVNIN